MPKKLLMGTLGAAGMYYFDPRLGRRRRALLRDKLVHLAHQARHGLELGTRDLGHRLQGLAAQGRHLVVRDGDADDRTIEARVRAALGRIVRRPRDVQVVSSGGIVLLTGTVAAHEHDALIGAVRMMRGVHGVNNDLDVRHGAEDPSAAAAVPAATEPPLTSLATSHGHTFELMQENWSPAARLLTSAAGGYVAASGLRHGGFTGAIKFAAGSLLFLRGVTNLDLARLTGVGAEDDGDGPPRGIDVHKTLNIRAGVGEVFGFFSNYDNFPLFMRNVREVRDRGDGYSHWVVAGPASVPVTWDAVLTDYEPNKCLAWQSVRGATVANAGKIRFDENPDGSTRVDIRLCYAPPGGLIGHALAALLRSDPKSEMDADLARLKTLIERGRFPHDAAQHASIMSPASPPIGTPTG